MCDLQGYGQLFKPPRKPVSLDSTFPNVPPSIMKSRCPAIWLFRILLIPLNALLRIATDCEWYGGLRIYSIDMHRRHHEQVEIDVGRR
jgi:hypothetical protein